MLNQLPGHVAICFAFMYGAVRIFEPNGYGLVLATNANDDTVQYTGFFDAVDFLDRRISARKSLNQRASRQVDVANRMI